MGTQELIHELPKGLINWYGFGSKSKILFVRGELESLLEYEEAFIEVLQESGLAISYMSIKEILNSGIKEADIRKFDYVLLVGLLEYCRDPVKLLSLVRGFLNSKGKLLLGTDNRLGIRYFCGDRDNFTGRNFDGIENYFRISETGNGDMTGRAYSKAELEGMLEKAGFIKHHFYSVLPDLFLPQLIYSEDYLPKEELDIRYFPSYHSPETVFLEEERLWSGLIQNGLFHIMANAYLIECPISGVSSNVRHVTISMERGKENALATIIRKDDVVVKRPVYPEGKGKLNCLINNANDLKEHGVPIVEARLDSDGYVMPYIHGESATNYFRRLLIEDRAHFLSQLDLFFGIILNSSEHISYEEVDWDHFDPDWKKQKLDDPECGKWRDIAFSGKADTLGVILKRGYVDLVSLNCFWTGSGFLFYDQEFYNENFPANVILWRTIDLIYWGSSQLEAHLPRQKVLERYHLGEYLDLWQRFSMRFVQKLRNERELASFRELHRCNADIVHSNRQRMNYSANEYQRVFINLFDHIEGKKIYLFGSGNYTKKFLSQFGKDYEISGILDNNPDKWGKKIEGLTIFNPDSLKDLQKNKYKVIICIKNYIPVLKQLKQLGVSNYGIYDWNLEYPRTTKSFMASDSGEDKALKKYHIGYIAGVFDLFHVGHLNLFKRAKEQCDYLIVGVVTDESVCRDKKTSPYIPFEERIELVRSCRFVDEAVEVPTEFGTTEEAYRRYRFDVQFSGSDYAEDPGWLAKKVFLEKQGADLVFFPYTQSTSSTKLKEMISKRLL